MAKQFKKGLLTILLFVMSICCAFSVNSFATVKADAPEMGEAFVADLNNFKTAANIVDDELTSDIDESIIVADDARVKAAMEIPAATEFFINMYKSSISGLLNETESAEFKKLMDVYNANEAVDLYAGVMDTARNIATQKGYSYKNHTEVEALETIFATIVTPACEADYAFLQSIPNFDFVDVDSVATPKYLADARVKIDAWKAVIDDAILAVKNIDVTTDMMSTVKIWHDGAYRADYTVVIESEATVEAARTAINAAKDQGDAAFVAEVELIVKAAEDALVADQNKILNVEELIKVAYEKFEAGKCYSNKAGIAEANTAYESLNGGSLNTPDALLNRLYDNVDSDRKDQIAKMNAEVLRIDHQINGCDAACAGHEIKENVFAAYFGVENYIAAIGDLAYTEEVEIAIKSARRNYELLPADVKTNDTTYVENYDVLVDAEEAWDAYIDQINDMIDAFNALMDTELNDRTNLFPAMDAAFKMPLSDKENQLTANGGKLEIGFNKNVLDEPFNPNDKYIDALTTSKDLYDHYTGIINSVRAATKNINDDLAVLLPLDVRFDVTFDSLFNKVDNAIEKLKVDGELDALYIGAIGVSTYNDFLATKDEYKNLLALASDWINKSIVVGPVCTCVFDKADAAIAAYNEIIAVYPVEADKLAADLAAFTLNFVIEGEDTVKTYADYNKIYIKLVAEKDEIIACMRGLESAAAFLQFKPANGVDDVMFDYYASLVEIVLKDMVKYDCAEHAGETYDYFKTNYAEIYSAVQELLIAVAAQDIEVAIAKIENDEDMNTINAARIAYDSAKDYKIEIKGIVDEEETVLYTLVVYTAEDVKAYVDTFGVLTDAEEIVLGFIDDVNALLIEAAKDGSDVDADDIDASALIAKVEDLEGFYKLNITKAAELKAYYEGLTADYRAYSYEVDGETLSVEDAYNLLLDLIKIAGTKNTSKIGFIDDITAAYLDKYYGKVAESPAEGEYELIEGLLEALDKTQLSLIESYTMENGFASLGKDRAMAAQLALAIIELDAIADVTEDTAINYYVINSIYESLSQAQKGLVNVSSLYAGDIDTTEEVLVAIKAKIDNAKVISITKIQSKLGELEGTIKALGEKDAQFEKLIKDLQTADNKLDGKISQTAEELKKLIAGVEKAYKDADVQIYEKINSIGKLIETNKADIAQLIKKVDGIYNNDIVKMQGQIAEIYAKIETIYEDMDKMEAEIKEYVDGKVSELNGKIDEMKAALEAKDTELADAIAKEIEDRAAAITAIEEVMATDTELAEAIADAKAEIKQVTDALDAAIKAEKAEREAADAAIKADLKAAVAKLNKTITIITIILAIVSAACVGAIVYIFLKKRA